jgi:hypothetical protein
LEHATPELVATMATARPKAIVGGMLDAAAASGSESHEIAALALVLQ